MIQFQTDRMIAKTEMILQSKKLMYMVRSFDETAFLKDDRPDTSMDDCFWFYDADNGNKICCIMILWKRNRFEVSYNTLEPYRNQGYMTEALKSLCKWLFDNTDQDVIFALPNGLCKEASIRILEKCNFIPSGVENELVWYELRKG